METKNKLLVVVCNNGFSGEVVEQSRLLGASGATILSGRGTAGITDTFLGMNITPEKEIVLIVLEEKIAAETMSHIAENFGVSTPACCFCFILPIEMYTRFTGKS
jgi:hypothetical protein